MSCFQVGVDWIARSLDASGRHLILFHGSKMIVKDVRENRMLAEVECGGGHRSWDIRVGQSRGSIIYIKAGIN